VRCEGVSHTIASESLCFFCVCKIQNTIDHAILITCFYVQEDEI